MKENIKARLKGKLSAKELSILRRSYDIIGTIILIEIPKLLEKKEKIIGKSLLEMHNNAKTVAKKIGAHEGKYRRQKLKIISGEKNTETLYKENNVAVKLDVEKAYFSPRLATERKRIAKHVKPGEKVLVMFSGCGPYPLVIAKNSRAREVYGVELNPVAYKYAVDSLNLNKLPNVKLIKGNVKKEIPKLKMKFDRIVMPLPKGAENYLDTAISASKKGTMIHFYDFSKEEDIPQKSTNKISGVCKMMKKRCKIIRYVKCGQTAPREYRVCVDFKVM